MYLVPFYHMKIWEFWEQIRIVKIIRSEKSRNGSRVKIALSRFASIFQPTAEGSFDKLVCDSKNSVFRIEKFKFPVFSSPFTFSAIKKPFNKERMWWRTAHSNRDILIEFDVASECSYTDHMIKNDVTLLKIHTKSALEYFFYYSIFNYLIRRMR